MKRRYLTLLLMPAFVMAMPGVAGAESPSQPRKVTSVEGITEYQLGNGLKVLLFPDPSKPTVTVNATYFVGSRHEGYGETGMAHLLEHMVFKGTPNHPAIWKSLQDHGAQFNGTTSYDRTNYFETLAANDANIEFALAMEADRMVNSRISPDDLKSEFSVVRNEFEQGENNAIGVLEERILSTAYLWHNYGKSTIGSRADIERVPADRLKAFYTKYYQPDNAMLVVAGNFDENKILARVNQLFGGIPRPTRKLDATYTVEPTQDGEREVTLRRVGNVQGIGACYHICAGSHPDMAAVEVLADVLDADQTGRLYKALIDTQLATNVRASAESLCDPGVLTIMAQVPADKSIDAVRTAMTGVLDTFSKQTISEQDVDRAKAAYAKRFEQLMGNTGRVAVTLSEWASKGDWRLMFLHRDRMKSVTPAHVTRVATTYLKPSNRTIGTFLPEQAPDRTTVPATPDLAAALNGYKGSAEVARGEAFDATPKNIESRTQRSQLSSGLKLAYLPKKTRGERVNGVLTLHYGTESDLKGRVEAASFLPQMLSAGTSKLDKRQLKDELDRLNATVSISGGMGASGRGSRYTGGGGGTPGTLAVSIETTRGNLHKVIELVGTMLRDPSFPAAEFDKQYKQTLSGIEQQKSEPTILAMLEARRRSSPYPATDIRYVPTVSERLQLAQSVTLQDVKRVYSEFLGAGNGEFAIVGDFDPATTTPVIEKTFGNWRSQKSFERIAMPFKPVQPDSVVIETPDKTNAMFAMCANIELRDDDADYAAAAMANFILGESANSRLMNRIRQKEGLSYGCGARLQAGSHEKNTEFLAYGICAPQNAEKAVACAKEEIARLCKDGVTQAELDDARKGYLEQFKVSLSNDGSLAGMIARQTYLNRTMTFTQDQLATIEKLTANDVNTAIRKYLSPDKLVVIRAGDFKGAN